MPKPPSVPRAWEPLATTPLQDCRVFEVSVTEARSPRTAEVHSFYRIDSSEWCNIIPITRDGEVVMVRQYRHGAREVTLEIPGGLVDPGETPAAAAARELLEETGYRAASVRALGVVNPNPALFGNRCHTFLAEEVEWERAVVNDSTEETVVELVSRADVKARVRNGDITHALVIAALYWWELSG